MKDRHLTILFTILAVLWWPFESFIHYYIFHESSFDLLPTDTNELWMRSLVFVMLVCLGVYADRQTGKIVAKEQQKRDIYLATVSSTQHILNNLINQLQICLYPKDENHGIDEETAKLLRQSLQESRDQVVRLSSISELDDDTIRQSVQPQKSK